LGVMDQFRGLRAHPILCRLISSCKGTLRTLFSRPLWPPSMKWSSELLLQLKQLHRKCWRTLGGKWIPLGHLTWGFTEASFLQVLRFPLPIFVPTNCFKNHPTCRQITYGERNQIPKSG
jgi:hypothetical protein